MKNSVTKKQNQFMIPWTLLTLLLLGWAISGTIIAAGSYIVAPTTWKDVDGDPLPFQSLEKIEDYLRTAAILENESIGIGTAGARKLLLEKDGVQVRACFRDVSVSRKQLKLASGKMEYDFRDEAKFELAAYEMGKLLGLTNIPPVVAREVGKSEGTVQLWIEDTMMESDRQEKEIQPPNLWRWAMELQVIHLFDNLIYNDDRNKQNMLIDFEWKVWMIDHTRAFRKHKQLQDSASITGCEKGIWTRLKELDEETVRAALEPYLAGWEMNGLITRMELLVEHIERLIEEKGESRVLFKIYPELDSEGIQMSELSN